MPSKKKYGHIRKPKQVRTQRPLARKFRRGGWRPFLPGIVLFAFFLPLLSACGEISGSGKQAQKTFDVSEFRRVFLVGQGNMEIVQGGEESLVVQAETNILPRVRVQVENENLWIRFEQGSWPDAIRPTRPVSYRLACRHIEALTLYGRGDVHAGSLETPSLTLDTAGSGSVRIDRLQAEMLTVRIHGSAEMVLAGTATDQDIEINGSGWVRGERLDCRRARIRINGSGTVRSRVLEQLDAEINGSGEVFYRGDATAETKIRGTGKIIHRM